MTEGRVLALCRADHRGPKASADQLTLLRNHGVEGDVHAGIWHRQVSLLADEDIERMRAKGVQLAPGAFGENVVTQGVDLLSLPLGQRFRLGPRAVLQVTQHGKQCHKPCVIQRQTGECIMPTRGIFARVLRGGGVRAGDALSVPDELSRLRFAVLTLSDRSHRKEREDRSGPLVRELVSDALRAHLVALDVLPDEQPEIEARLTQLCDDELCDLVVTTGGTGLSPRDVTPEATLAVIDREIPGIAEAMRVEGLKHTPHAMFSRAVCGQRGSTVIINLSGSPRAVQEQLDVVLPALPHAMAVASGIPQDCAR